MSMIDIQQDGALATLALDDGKANAMDLAFFAELDEALDSVASSGAIVIAGREGMFSAGLNIKIIADLDTDGLTDLLVAFGRTMLRLWGEPRPVVAAATGHALAGGTVLAMCCDHAVAADGEYRWGLTETTIGFPMPGWVLAIARGNIRADRLDDLVLPGSMIGPSQAAEVGYVDEVVAPELVFEVAREHALGLAELPANVYAFTKRQLRGARIDQALAELETDVAAAMAAREM